MYGKEFLENIKNGDYADFDFVAARSEADAVYFPKDIQKNLVTVENALKAFQSTSADVKLIREHFTRIKGIGSDMNAAQILEAQGLQFPVSWEIAKATLEQAWNYYQSEFKLESQRSKMGLSMGESLQGEVSGSNDKGAVDAILKLHELFELDIQDQMRWCTKGSANAEFKGAVARTKLDESDPNHFNKEQAGEVLSRTEYFRPTKGSLEIDNEMQAERDRAKQEVNILINSLRVNQYGNKSWEEFSQMDSLPKWLKQAIHRLENDPKEFLHVSQVYKASGSTATPMGK